MMMGWLRRWMSAPDDPDRDTVGGSQCCKCSRIAEDGRYRHCARCRALARARARRQLHKRRALDRCTYCGGVKGREGALCAPCLRIKRERYHGIRDNRRLT